MFSFFIKIVTNDKFYLPVLYIAIGVLVYQIISQTIIRVNKMDSKLKKGNHSQGYDKRKSTVVGLINNIIKYIIAIIIIVAILNVYGVNTTNIIASLGIASLVIGLAFQDIIKDFLAGIFIIFDNAYAVGDWIKIDDFRGEVISMGLKTTKIRAYTGEIMCLSNSSFTKVINYNLDNQNVYIQIPFSYDTKIIKVEEVLSGVMIELKKDKDVKSAELLGVESFDESCMSYSVLIKCNAGSQFRIKRLLLRDIKFAFDENDIVIPYNKLDIYMKK